MKTTWNIICKEKDNPTNENDIKLLRINNHILHNPISTANEFNDYFLNIAGSISYKRINKKNEDISPLQNLIKYFNQPFKDISWPYTSTTEINKIKTCFPQMIRSIISSQDLKPTYIHLLLT
jgi:hypothetical protein